MNHSNRSSSSDWPGGGGVDHAAFYSYACPALDGFSRARVQPDGASWSSQLGEFLLPYHDVQTAASPDDTLTGFLQSTDESAAELANRERSGLEREPGPQA